MHALVFHKPHDVRYETVPDPKIEQDRDAIIRVTSTAICGSDLHIFDGLLPITMTANGEDRRAPEPEPVREPKQEPPMREPPKRTPPAGDPRIDKGGSGPAGEPPRPGPAPGEPAPEIDDPIADRT